MGCIFASSIGRSEPRATKPTGHAHTYGRQEVDGKGWASVKYHSFRTLHNTAQTFDSKVSFENSSYVDDSLIFLKSCVNLHQLPFVSARALISEHRLTGP